MIKRFINRLRKFRRDDDGSIIAETVIMFPTLFAAVLATFVFFDAFRNQSINLKATYTISDALSRETRTISNTFLVNSWRMHRFLTDSPSLTRLRISAIKFDGDTEKYALIYSRAKGGAPQLTDAGLARMVAAGDVPLLTPDRVLFIVQTWVDYEPNFSIGLRSFSFETTVYTTPREVPDQTCYSEDGTDTNRICAFGS